jgi:hypothetical protein
MTIEPHSETGAAGQAGTAWRTWVTGIICGDLVIGLLYGAAWLVMRNKEDYALLGVPSFFLMPAAGGLVASYFWRGLKPRIGETASHTLWMTIVALVGATIAFHEGFICLVIVSPLFYASIFAGALVGRIWFRTVPPRLRLGFLPLVAIVVWGEPFARAPHESVVTDELVIHASPEKVWPLVTSFPQIPAKPNFWLFRMGLPYPSATTSAGDFINADRECIFSHGAVFKEKVAEFVPREKLTFRIVEIPKDPELTGHLTPRLGQFVLRPNADGTTTLIGSTWYTLHVRPLWYFDLWTRHIFRAVHLRVMEDIRHRAELAS